MEERGTELRLGFPAGNWEGRSAIADSMTKIWGKIGACPVCRCNALLGVRNRRNSMEEEGSKEKNSKKKKKEGRWMVH